MRNIIPSHENISDLSGSLLRTLNVPVYQTDCLSITLAANDLFDVIVAAREAGTGTCSIYCDRVKGIEDIYAE